MNNQILFSIIITSLVWGILALYLWHSIKEIRLSKEKELSNLQLEHEKTINRIKEKFTVENRTEFDRGFESAKNSSNFKIQVEPYKNISGEKRLFNDKQILEIGYVYRLFVDGVPSLDPHIQIVQRIKKNEINEQNIKIAIDKIYDIIGKVPSPHLKVVGNIKDFGSNMLTSFKKKKK